VNPASLALGEETVEEGAAILAGGCSLFVAHEEVM